ncbi:MAG: hypothetical protein ACRDIF_00435 [Actinomycetota bacterium]
MDNVLGGLVDSEQEAVLFASDQMALPSTPKNPPRAGSRAAETSRGVRARLPSSSTHVFRVNRETGRPMRRSSSTASVVRTQTLDVEGTAS